MVWWPVKAICLFQVISLSFYLIIYFIYLVMLCGESETFKVHLAIFKIIYVISLITVSLNNNNNQNMYQRKYNK